MTVRDIYDALQSEMNKEEAPSLLLDTFNYLHGKAINEVTNSWYSLFEETQLLTDNLRPLTKPLTISRANLTTGNFYILPVDYWHMLPSIIVKFERNDNLDPCNKGKDFYTFQKPAIKLNSQIYSGIIKDYYTKPSYKKPYFMMHNYVENNVTYGIEVRSGSTDLYIPKEISIDYLKTPKLPKVTLDHSTRILDPNNIFLTQDELESDTDISAVMEFSDNFCYEILNKLTALVMENNGDPRLNNNLPLNQSMIPPKQA